MTIFQQVLFVISAASTIILVIQTILALVGMAGNGDGEIGESYVGDGGDADADFADAGADADMDLELEGVDSANIDGDLPVTSETVASTAQSHASNFDARGLKLFTVRGIMAFLMVGSWVGFLLSRAGIPDVMALACAFISGFIALFLMAKLMQALMGLQADGTTNVKNALGKVGQVYIRIPGEEKGTGKVNVTVQEKLCEFDAVTESGEAIQTGEMVYVTDVRSGNVLVVEKVEGKQ